MKKIIAMGEALIDFIPHEKSVPLSEVTSFTRVCGGGPANLCAASAKLGGDARLVCCVGTDSFGDYIVRELSSAGVDISRIKRTGEAKTTLAFVSLKADGNRDFSFYRSPGADMLLYPADITENTLECGPSGGFFHYSSVDLIDSPTKDAHYTAISLAKRMGLTVCFDPNIRLPLWDSPEHCQRVVREFIPYADIIKISDEELEFVTGERSEEAGIASLLKTASLILYTLGPDGARLISRDFDLTCRSPKLTAVDTTGAGDASFGGLLYAMASDDASFPKTREKALEYLRFAVGVSSYSVTGRGAIASYGTLTQIRDFMNGHM